MESRRKQRLTTGPSIEQLSAVENIHEQVKQIADEQCWTNMSLTPLNLNTFVGRADNKTLAFLLNWSVGTFLIGHGVWLYLRNLDSSHSPSSSWVVFIIIL